MICKQFRKHGIFGVGRALLRFGLILFVAACPRPAQAQTRILPGITTVAGNGTYGYAGDGGPATSASITNDWGVAVDSAGNFYFTDESNCAVRKVDVNGTISTIAGGTCGYGGDGGPAINAQLDNPEGIAVDGAGNVYFADSSNQVIRKIDTLGVITTVAGTPGVTGYSGDGGPATSAKMTVPYGVAVDRLGNLYIADVNDSVIRKVDLTGTITRVAGTPGVSGFAGDGGPATSAKLSAPYGVFADRVGNLYIADVNNSVIRKVTPAGTISTVAGTPGVCSYSGDGGPATSATLCGPYRAIADDDANLYIADNYNSVIRRVDAGGTITTLAGDGNYANSGDGGPAKLASLGAPFDLALDSERNLYIPDYDFSVVRKIAPGNIFPKTPIASTSQQQNVFLELTADQTISSISVPQSAGGKQEYSVGTISGCVVNGATTNISGTICTVPITFAPAYVGKRWIPLQVANSAGNVNFGLQGTGVGPLVGLTPGVISTFAGNGTIGFSGDGGPATGAQISVPIDIAFDVTGNMYVSTSDNRIRKIDASSNVITTFAGTGVATYSGDGGPAILAGFGPSGMAFDSAGNLYFADQSNNRIRKIDVNTSNISTVAGTGSAGSSGDGGLATAAQINGPRGVAFDQWGNLYIAEGSRIRKVTAGSGIITTFAGTGTVGFSGDGGLATAAMLRLPVDLEFDSSGNLYFSDNTNQRVRRIDSVSGVITTVAGSGATGSFAGGFSGDGGPATSALLKNPSRIYIDPAGNLYIADANRRIRRVDASTGFISTIIGNGSTSPVGDGGPATAASINGASGVGMDTAANLYTGEITNPRVRKVNLQLSQLNYPTPTTVGTSSVDNPQTAIVTNIGNASLTVPPPTSGSNPSAPPSFEFDSSSTCPQLSTSSNAQTLGVDESCTLAIDFMPAAAGPITGSAVLTNNSLNTVGAATIQLSGTGVAVSTTTTINGSPNPSTYSQAVSFTATVGPTMGTTNATGTLQFNVDGTPLNSPVTLSNGTATFTTSALAVGSHTVTADYIPGSSAFTASTSSTGQTVNKATFGQNGLANITLASSPNPSGYQQSVTFTATVPLGATGTIQFMEGTALLGTGTISGTTATFTTSTLAIGSHPVTAVYSGDASYNAATTSADTQVVSNQLDFMLKTMSPESQTVVPGHTASYTLQVAPTNTSYPGTVTFAATGLPAGASIAFSPSTVAVNGGTTPITVTIPTSVQSAFSQEENHFGYGALAFVCLPFAALGSLRRKLPADRRRIFIALFLLSALAATTGLAGCGSANGNGFFGQAPQSYTITITATSGSVQHSVAVQLNVQ